MPTIPVQQAKNIFTQDLYQVLNIVPPRTEHLMGKFTSRYKPVDYISWQVRRWTEVAASSIVRGTNGTRVKATGFTQKIEQAPFFHLNFNMMELEGYTAAFGTQNPAESAVDDALEQTSTMFSEMKQMINRRYEIMASQALQTGIVLDATTGNIDYKRNPISMPDLGTGNYWDQATVNPFDIMEQGGIFLRQYGKIQSDIIDCDMGASAFRQFLLNPFVLARAQKLWNELTQLTMPAPRGDGSVFMGQVSAGVYRINIYTYPHFYTASTEYQAAINIITLAGTVAQNATANTSVPYINDTNIIMTPPKMNSIMGYSLVPKLPMQMMDVNGSMGEIGDIEGGKFFAYDFQDIKLTAWEMNLKSAGLAILSDVDEVFTAKVMAA